MSVLLCLASALLLAPACAHQDDSDGSGAPGQTGAASTEVADSSADPAVPGSDEAILALLEGAWDASEMADSGNPAEPVPAGMWTLVFNTDLTISSGCGSEGSPYALQNGVIFPSGELRWTIVELSEDRLGFEEGGDQFFFQRSTCAE